MREVEFFGDTFALGELPQFLLMEFAETVEGADENGMPVAAAMMRLLKEAVSEKDWPRFRNLAVKHKATGEHLMPVIEAAVADERPTVRSSGSSGGPTSTASRSVSPAVAKVLAQEAGRPDRQMGILRSA